MRFIEHALKLNLEYFGEKSMHVAVSYHLVARTQSCMGDFRSALNNEKETYSIYKTQVLKNDPYSYNMTARYLLFFFSLENNMKKLKNQQNAYVY